MVDYLPLMQLSKVVLLVRFLDVMVQVGLFIQCYSTMTRLFVNFITKIWTVVVNKQLDLVEVRMRIVNLQLMP